MNADYSTSSSLSYPMEELLSASSIIFYHCKAQEHFPLLFMSGNVKEILGLETEKFWEDEALWINRVHPEDRKMVSKKFQSIYEKEQFSVEFRFQHGDGHFIWLHDEVKLIRDEDGKPDTVVGSSIEVTERKDAEKELQFLNRQLENRIEERTVDLMMANRRLKLLELAIANINDMVIITKAPKEDPLDSEIVFVNRAFEEFTGYSMSEIEGKKPTFLHGEKTSEQALKYIEEQINNLRPLRVEFINYKKDGSTYWVELDMAPFPSEKEDEIYWVGINRNITHRKQADQKLKDSLKEKEVLLSEIHHRVKNNLAIISGLLDLQAFNAEDEIVLRELRESQSRIQSIAMVHEKLYQSSSLSSIEMKTYVNQLTDYISGILSGDGEEIEIRNNAEAIGLGINQAVPCGLILNELLTNAFKHAFKQKKGGVIEVDLHKRDNKIEMQIRDNGKGLPDDFDFSSSQSLGITLVQTLVDQLDADIDIQSGPQGTSIAISFINKD